MSVKNPDTFPNSSENIPVLKRRSHPNSLKNLNRGGTFPGAGRPPDTPERKLQQRCIRDYYKQYLTNGEAIADFERLREKKPDTALYMAETRTYGPPVQQVRHSGTITLDALLNGFAQDTETVVLDVESTDVTDATDG